MEYLVDTDWVIHYLNGDEGVQERLDALAPSGIAVSVITLAEVYQGVFYSRDPEGNELQFMRFLAGCEVLGLNDTICRLFARERGRLTAAGRVIGDFDILIGVTAVHHGLTLLSNNRRHFERISGLTMESILDG